MPSPCGPVGPGGPGLPTLPYDKQVQLLQLWSKSYLCAGKLNLENFNTEVSDSTATKHYNY